MSLNGGKDERYDTQVGPEMPVYEDEYLEMLKRHRDMIKAIIPDETKREELMKTVNGLFDELRSILYGIHLIKDLSPKTMDVIVSYGERISSPIVAALIDGAEWKDSRTFIKTEVKQGKRSLADKYRSGVQQLTYPSADVRDLAQYFPVITGGFELKDGSYLLTVSKSEEVFPLGAFGSLPPVHAAWIVSRIENLCCVMEYSNITHGGIDLDGMFINARTHELYLLGGWENVTVGSSTKDLAMMRQNIKRLIGKEASKAPREFTEFLDKKALPDAYTDFSDWDNVIEKGFGGRRFEKLDLTDINV